MLFGALDLKTPSSSLASNAISDALSTAHHVACRYTEIHSRSVSVTLIELIQWNGQKESSDNEKCPNDILRCDENIMTAMDKLRPIIHAEIYGEFFQDLFLCVRRKEKVSGPVKYSTLTPPWLSRKILFVHGESGNSSTSYSVGILPRKSVIRKSGNKTLGRAILCQFIMREDSCADYLKPIFSKGYIQIPSCS